MCPTILPAVACIIGEDLRNSKYLSHNHIPIMTKGVKISVRMAGSRPNKAPPLFCCFFLIFCLQMYGTSSIRGGGLGAGMFIFYFDFIADATLGA